MRDRWARFVWGAHVTTMVTAVTWALIDPRFQSMASSLRPPRPMSDQGLADMLHGAVSDAGHLRLTLLACLATIAAASGSLMLFELVAGTRRPRSRSISAIIGMTTVAGLWCGFLTHHSALSWQGKRLRLAWQLKALESIAEPLRDDWPRQDGHRPGIGPFMAYPFGQPRTLVLLTPPNLSFASNAVNTVERSEGGALRFRLSGSEFGATDWAEWHPPASQPRSYNGGLGECYEFYASTPLGSGWHLGPIPRRQRLERRHRLERRSGPRPRVNPPSKNGSTMMRRSRVT